MTAATPPADYDSVAGDLHEEYLTRRAARGRAHADRWYWSQALRSVPPLLSYSRVRPGLPSGIATAAVVVALLFAMLIAKELVDALIDAAFPLLRGWPFFAADWSVAAAFGALLAMVLRTHGVRISLIASSVLIAGFALPIVLGLSAPISPLAWLLLLGAMPAMSAGAATYHIVRRR